MGAALGINKSVVSRLAARGMPLNSVEEANHWRSIHAPPRAKAQRGPTTASHPNIPNTTTIDSPAAIEGDADSDPRASLKRATQAERIGYNEVLKCQQSNATVEDYRKAVSVFVSAQNNLTKAKRDFREWQHAEKITLFYSEAVEIYGRPLNIAKQKFDGMPKTLAPRLFNQPQKAIEQTLAEWVDGLTAIIREGME